MEEETVPQLMNKYVASTKMFELIDKLVDSGYWGHLDIKFENGEIVHCKKAENIKL